MAKANKVLVRLGVSDIVLTQEEIEKSGTYLQLLDSDGNVIVETDTYLVGYEDEDGNECYKDGEFKLEK